MMFSMDNICIKLFLQIFSVLCSVGLIFSSCLLAADELKLEMYEDTQVGFTKEGYPFRGNPDASVVLEEYSDYLCPFCSRHFSQTLPALLDTYVRNGKVKYVFHDFPIASLHPTAAKGSEATLCVAEQGAVLFWKMHDELFRVQREWSRLPDPSDFLANVANKIGVNMDTYGKCLESGRKHLDIQKSVSSGKGLKFNGTPSFQFIERKSGDTYTLVGAVPLASFSRLADPLLEGKKPPEVPKPKPPELPFWSKAEGLAVNPAQAGLNMAGDPYKGSPDAQITVIEFSDFQCAACQKHALEFQPEIDRDYVDTGKVRWVMKHFPLRIHPYAALAAVTAECAGMQGKFWEMKHTLFEKMDEWSKDEVDIHLIQLAMDLKLEMSQFLTCFNSRKGLELVLNDLYDAQGIITQTPTYIIIHDGKGMSLKGASSIKRFTALFDKMLKQKSKADK